MASRSGFHRCKVCCSRHGVLRCVVEHVCMSLLAHSWVVGTNVLRSILRQANCNSCTVSRLTWGVVKVLMGRE